MLPAISVNKRCCSHQAITLQPPRWCTLRRLRMRKHRILALDSQGAYQRNDFNEPRLLHLPILRKALNSIAWDVWLCLINSHLLMSWLAGVCCKNSCISSFLSYLFGAAPQSWEAVSRVWSSQNVHWVKHNSQLLGCAFFFQLTVPSQLEFLPLSIPLTPQHM